MKRRAQHRRPVVWRACIALVAGSAVTACASSAGPTQIPGAEPFVTAPAGEAGAAGSASTDAAVEPTTTTAVSTTTTPLTTTPPTTAPPTTVPPTTVPPTTATPTTVPPTTAAPSTVPPTTAAPTTAAPAPAPTPAPPVTAVPLAPCVNGELSFFTEGRRGEIALYQQTLANLGYDPGDIDGFFGQNTYTAASREILDNGDVNGPNGTFTELFPDDGAVLPAAFVRLGIAC